jgi:hypothetical protein
MAMTTGFLSDKDIEESVALADLLAHFYVDMPEPDMMVELHDVRACVFAELVAKVGTELATILAEAFVATVVRRRREIEAGTPRVLH